MLHTRFLFLACLIALILLNNRLQAQTCTPCGLTIDLTVSPYSTGTAYTGTVAPTIANQTVCIKGPTSGTPATFNPSSWTFNGINNVCFSGKINMTYNFAGAGFGKGPIFVFQAGSVISHTGTFDINGGYAANKAYIYNYGSYTNNSTSSFLLKGTELHNEATGTFNVPNAEVIISTNGLTSINTVNNGIITFGKVFDINWGPGSDSFTNNGQLTAQCFYGHNSVGTFTSPTGSALTFNGTDAGCIALQGALNYAFDTKNTVLVLNGTLNVPNATASFNSTSTATDLKNAKVYVKNFYAPSYKFNTGTGCLSIQVDNVVTINSGNSYTGLIYIYDKTYSTTSLDNGDLFAGSRFTTSNGNFIALNTPTTKMIYSSSDGSGAAGCPVLPVVFVNFNAVQTPNGNQLTWTTSKEVNSDYFNVERSSDGINFEPVGVVNANGNSSSLSKYQYLDKDVTSDVVYYRLNEIDKDGKNMYSSIVAISIEKDEIALLLNNPVKDEIKIQLLTAEDNTISLLNAQGNPLFEKSYTGNQLVSINSKFSPGVYLIKVSNQSKTSYIKTVIE